MKPVKNLVATVGKKADGNAIYQRVGTFFKRDDGTFVAKLDALPIGKDWDGWVNLYDMDPPKETPQQRAAAAQAPPELDDEVPF